MKKTILTISLLFLVGCGSSNGKDGTITVTSGEKEDKLGTLSTEKLDLGEALLGEKWIKLTTNLDKFYATTISDYVNYEIEMSFKDNEVVAYADCKKLTARYKIRDNELSFSKVTYNSDPDHASCKPSEDADQAVNQFLSNSFEATKINQNQITFKADDFDVELILER